MGRMRGNPDILGRYHVITTGQMIKNHLSAGPDYVMNIYRAIKHQCDEYGYKAPSYASIRTYIYRLKNARLILEVEGTPISPIPDTATEGRRQSPMLENEMFQRRYYRLNRSAVNSPAWNDVTEALGAERGWRPR